jgi:tripartite-type tricarboxylate transporter receptor subunit TctC
MAAIQNLAQLQLLSFKFSRKSKMIKRQISTRFPGLLSLLSLSAALFAVTFASGAAAQTAVAAYPAKPITIITLTTPGGSLDTLARAIGIGLQRQMGQPVIVESKLGAGGNIGAEALAHAVPDGYTIGMITSSTHGINPSLYGSAMRFDAIKDFSPIIIAAELNNVVVVNSSLPIHSIPELVAYAKAHPNELSFGSAGTGTSQHLAGELMNILANIKMTHVPYKGAAQAVPDLLGGRVQLMFASIPDVIAYIKSGKLRAIGVTGIKRSRAVPDAVPVAEQGYPTFNVTGWFGVAAPAKTPPEIVARLNREIAAALAVPETQEKLISLGLDPVTSTPEQAATFIKSEIDRWGKLVKQSGAKLQ